MSGNHLHAIGTKNDDAIADVIFVHGLDGHWKSTWASSNASTSGSWPQWLADEERALNVWSLEYNSSSTAWFGRGMDILSAATSLLDRLPQSEIGKRPIIFVTHSLGGLVVKQMLRSANDSNNSEWKEILNSTRGIAFLATPHSGAGLANFIETLGQALGVFGFFFRRQKTIDNLKANNPELAELNNWYRNHVERLGISSKVYCEDVGVKGVMVVDRTSANPGLRDVSPIPISRDHIGICKPPLKDDQVCVGVSRFITSCLNDKRLETANGSEKETEPNEKTESADSGTQKAVLKPVAKTLISDEKPRSEAQKNITLGANECVKIFLSRDPAKAIEVIPELSQCGIEAYDQILDQAKNNRQSVVLLLELTKSIGSEALPILYKALENGSRNKKQAAAPCLMAFRGSIEAENNLYRILRDNSKFDARRLTIEAIGYLGSVDLCTEIINCALYDDLKSPDRTEEYTRVNDYAFGKLYSCVLAAMMRMFGASGSNIVLGRLEKFIDVCAERHKLIDTSFKSATSDMTLATADAVQDRWLSHSNTTYRRYGLMLLEPIKVQRTLTSLISIVKNLSEDDAVLRYADFCIASLSSKRAANVVFDSVENGLDVSRVRYSVSTLFSQPVEYTMQNAMVDSFLGKYDEPNQQLLLALGWRGLSQYEEAMLSGLDHTKGFVRGTAAAALAILLGDAAKSRLMQSRKDATNDMEKVLITAALVHCGAFEMLDKLHKHLQTFELFPDLRPIWARYVLTAFLKVEGMSPRAMIWSRIVNEDLEAVAAEFDAKSKFFKRTK